MSNPYWRSVPRSALMHRGRVLTHALEELVGELGCVYVTGNCRLVDATIEGHATCLDGCLQMLKSDRTAVVTAARHSEAAFEFILAREMPLLDTARLFLSKE